MRAIFASLQKAHEKAVLNLRIKWLALCLFNDSRIDILLSQSGAFDRDVCILCVKYEAFAKQVSKALVWPFCQTPGNEFADVQRGALFLPSDYARSSCLEYNKKSC